jgi:hypothetical protein
MAKAVLELARQRILSFLTDRYEAAFYESEKKRDPAGFVPVCRNTDPFIAVIISVAFGAVRYDPIDILRLFALKTGLINSAELPAVWKWLYDDQNAQSYKRCSSRCGACDNPEQ